LGDKGFELHDVWGTGASGAFSPDNWGSAVLHCDGSSWSSINVLADHFANAPGACSPECNPPSINLQGVSGTGPSDVLIVGYDTDLDASVILHFDGTTWSAVFTGASASLSAVREVSSTNIVAVGWDYDANQNQVGAVVCYDGSNWWETSGADAGAQGGLPMPLHHVWGADSLSVVAVDESGLVQHNDNGSLWSPLCGSPPGVPPLYGVWGSAASDLYAVGDPLPDGSQYILHLLTLAK